MAALSRRRFIALVGGVAAATGLPPAEVARLLAQDGDPRAAARDLTTLARTLGPGAPLNPLGYRPVVSGPGEEHVVREDLGAKAQAGRHRRRVSLLHFVHLTDQHVIDAQSPTRVEFLDRYADGQCAPIPFSSAHRPQEAASARLVDAMNRRIRQIRVSPVTGAPITAAICTGDNTDNQQANELALFIGLMDGGAIHPQSGDRTRYEGVQASGTLDYWHPDPAVADLYKTRFGFPARAGFLDAALSPFTGAGVGTPWYTCYGNHDGLEQGNSPATPLTEAISVGPVKAVGLPSGANPCSRFAGAGAAPGAPAMAVTADPERRFVRRKEWVEAHLASPGLPAGHGYTAANAAAGTAYYAAEVRGVRFLVLDTVNPGGFSEGSVGDAQMRWLESQLRDAQQRRRLTILFSHHGPRSLTNPFQEPDPFEPTTGDLPRHTADAVLAVVNRYSCVIAWVNGHTHDNVITTRSTFWDIGTAAHIDWPAQARLVEVVDNHDGTLSIFGTLFDIDEGDGTAVFARELMGNDPQAGFATGTGRPPDRNVELVIAHPFAAGASEAVGPAPAGRSREAAGYLPATGLPAGLTVGGAVAVAAAIGVRALREAAGRAPS